MNKLSCTSQVTLTEQCPAPIEFMHLVERQISHTNITAVQRRSPPFRGSGITHLVVYNKVDAPTNSEVGEI